MYNPLIPCTALAVMALLGGCASAPRAPATTLAEAGIKATGSMGTEVRLMETELGSMAVGSAFTATLGQCANANLTCKEIVEPDEIVNERGQLARTVAMRAKAIDALGAAYTALQTEAAYDQGADLSAATGQAVAAAEGFAVEAAKLTNRPSPPAVPAGVASLADFGFGLLGEQLQRKRILAASRRIAGATLLVRNGMVAEAGSFASLNEYLVEERVTTRIALMKAGSLSQDTVLKQISDQLNLSLTPPTNASPAAYEMALQAAMRALAQQEVADVNGRYQAGIAALGALLQSHAELEKGKALSIGNVERVLTRLDAALDQTSPPPPGQ
jgi:hypothetical protein